MQSQVRCCRVLLSATRSDQRRMTRGEARPHPPPPKLTCPAVAALGVLLIVPASSQSAPAC